MARQAEADAARRAAEEETRRKAEAAAAAQRRTEAEAARKAAEEETRRKAEAAEAARQKAEADARAEREAALQRRLAAEEEAASFARSGVIDEYRSLLVQTIERNWIRPPSARAGLQCTLYVTQAPGGTVVDVRLGACNGDEPVRESIVNAVYKSSPLPAPRDPRAFERRLEIVFRPTE
jgi:colicin import membrane protein